jgi:hypothetical protein
MYKWCFRWIYKMSWLARCAVARVVVALEVAVERVAVVFAVPHLLLTSHFIHFDRSLRHCLTHSLTHSLRFSAQCWVWCGSAKESWTSCTSLRTHPQVSATSKSPTMTTTTKRWVRHSLTHSLPNSLPPSPSFLLIKSLTHFLVFNMWTVVFPLERIDRGWYPRNLFSAGQHQRTGPVG